MLLDFRLDFLSSHTPEETHLERSSVLSGRAFAGASLSVRLPSRTNGFAAYSRAGGDLNAGVEVLLGDHLEGLVSRELARRTDEAGAHVHRDGASYGSR